ncbi:MAG TPA: fibronectin type III domain-containing protein [Candidatus Thermoplasmatota archaeon]|nr:fibronectin type III domain-containing protein [Candidatus Thermoplasmatota archaeon]
MSNRAASFIVLALLVPLAAPFVPGAGALPSTAPRYSTYVGPDENQVFTVFIDSGGEPSIGVDWRTGEILYQRGFHTFRAELQDDGGSDWIDVSAPNTPFNIDPMLFTDSATGRTFAGGLDGMCSSMAITDDGGRTWIPAGNMCVPTLDHQTIASGPWAATTLPSSPAFDRATYYCAQASAVTCITSQDGGLTWGPPVPVTCGFVDPGFHGSVHVGPDGKVFLPFKNCQGGAGVAVSADNGLTWTSHKVPSAVYPGAGFDPDVATTPSGWLYLGYANGATGAATATMSKDNGTTWSTPVDVGAPLGVVASTFHEMVAGDDGRAALAFLGTTTAGNGYDPAFAGVWDLYVATTYDAGATWTTVKASTDPVQRGWICAGGTGCATDESGHRNMLDFMDAQVDAQGRVLVGYADGCTGECAGPAGTSAQSFHSQATITRQSSGLTLFSAFDPSTGALFATGGGPYTTQAGSAVALDGEAANGVAPYSYSWSVLSRPAGSAAGASSIAAAATAGASFTPDVVGDYLLRFEARDASGERAVDVVKVTAASLPGVPVATCGVPLASDAVGDSTAAGAGSSRRDITSVSASDAQGIWTLCVSVASMAEAATAGSKFTFFWDAPYELPLITYSASATVTAGGTVGSAQFSKGVAGVTLAQLGGPASASLDGDTLRITLPRPGVGGPQDGESATNLFVRVENTATPTTTWDRAPDAGGLAYTFGHNAPDAVAPAQVTGLAGEDAQTGGLVNLSWDASSDDIGVKDYVVRRSTLAGGPYRTVALVEGLAFQDAGLVDGTAYYYAIGARDGAGNIGPLSAEVAVTPTGPGGPAGDTSAPTSPGSLATSALASTSLTLTWLAADDPETGIDHYEVYKDGVRIAQTTLLTQSVGGLAPSTSYDLEVRAVNGAGLVGAGATLTVTTPARPPDCGQAASPFTLATDAGGDSARGDGRAEIVRVGVKETSTRIGFYVSLADASTPAPNTMFRVSWRTDDLHGFALYVRLTDAGAAPAGVWVVTPANEVNTLRQPQFGLQCDTVFISVQKQDLLNPAPGELLRDLRVTASVDTTNPPESQIYDAAPDTGGVDYVMGSAA